MIIGVNPVEEALRQLKKGRAESQPPGKETAFSTRRVYLIPPGLLRAGEENVLAISVWNRNAASKGWKAWLRGPISIRPDGEEKNAFYIGERKPGDNPYLQRHW